MKRFRLILQGSGLLLIITVIYLIYANRMALALMLMLGLAIIASAALLFIAAFRYYLSEPTEDTPPAVSVKRTETINVSLLWILSIIGLAVIVRLLCWAVPGAGFKQATTAGTDDGKIKITLLQINDVYEITALDSGRSGGLARVATLRKRLEKDNPNTFTLLAGDFISPSAIGTLKYDDMRMAGRQMIEVLNATGVDLVTFGNHEFDRTQPELQKCIDTSTFDWVSSNIKPLYSSGKFIKNRNGIREEIPSVYIKRFTDEDGTAVSVGFIGLTIKSSAGTDYVFYEDFLAGAGKAIRELQGKCDFIIALTHLSLDEDKLLAKKFPGLKMIIGGHEHTASRDTIGDVLIMKADANAKSAFKHFLEYNTATRTLSIKSDLQMITDATVNDPAVQAVVELWNARSTDLLRKEKGREPCEVVATLTATFDGTEKSVRYKRTNLTTAISETMMAFAKDNGLSADCALYNSGSLRLDDSLKGTVTYYDLFRLLPYPTTIRMDTLKGEVIRRLLNISWNNKGDGCFLQHANISGDSSRWKINSEDIDPNKDYRVVMNTYLAEGRQDKMEFLKDNKRWGKKTGDLLDLLGAYMKKRFNPRTDSTKRAMVIPCY